MAVNCCLVPRVILEFTGVITRETRIAGVTVNVVVPDMLLSDAVIVVEPVATDVARPFDPEALLISATPASDEYQATDSVTFCVVLSEKVPVVVNWRLVPRAMLGSAGVIVKNIGVAGVTVRMVVPEMLPSDAVIVVGPVVREIAIPIDPAMLLINATEGSDELQIADAVRSCTV